MMNLLTREDLKRLSAVTDDPCVSLYMPAIPSGRETRQNPTRFRNLLRKAQEELVAAGFRPAETEALLAPAYDTLDSVDLWQHQSRGFAAFLYSGGFEYYQLPIEFEEIISVSGRFYVKPLIPLFSGDGRYFVLSLSMRENRLYLAGRYTMSEVAVPGAPTAIEDFEEHEEERLLIRYLRRLDNAVHRRLATESAPLVLVGLEHIASLYQQVTTYPHVSETSIIVNPDGISIDELHTKAWNAVAATFDSERKSALARYHDLSATPTATDNLRAIVPAGFHSRVGTLFVPPSRSVWGRYTPGETQATVHRERTEGDEDLLDVATVQALLHGGTVYAVSEEDIPSGAPCAAIFRY